MLQSLSEYLKQIPSYELLLGLASDNVQPELPRRSLMNTPRRKKTNGNYSYCLNISCTIPFTFRMGTDSVTRKTLLSDRLQPTYLNGDSHLLSFGRWRGSTELLCTFLVGRVGPRPPADTRTLVSVSGASPLWCWRVSERKQVPKHSALRRDKEAGKSASPKIPFMYIVSHIIFRTTVVTRQSTDGPTNRPTDQPTDPPTDPPTD